MENILLLGSCSGSCYSLQVMGIEKSKVNILDEQFFFCKYMKFFYIWNDQVLFVYNLNYLKIIENVDS